MPLWAFWTKQNLADSRMAGWRSSDHRPVTTNDTDVKATACVLVDKMVIALANFGNVTKHVTLVFATAGQWHPRLEAPAVEAFQPAQTFHASQTSCASKRGWLLVVRRQQLEQIRHRSVTDPSWIRGVP